MRPWFVVADRAQELFDLVLVFQPNAGASDWGLITSVKVSVWCVLVRARHSIAGEDCWQCSLAAAVSQWVEGAP